MVARRHGSKYVSRNGKLRVSIISTKQSESTGSGVVR